MSPSGDQQYETIATFQCKDCDHKEQHLVAVIEQRFEAELLPVVPQGARQPTRNVARFSTRAQRRCPSCDQIMKATILVERQFHSGQMEAPLNTGADS